MAHISVLLHEVLDLLKPEPGDFFIDGTADGGGHSAAFLAAVGEKGKILCTDLDPDMTAGLSERFAKFENALVRTASYTDIPDILSRESLPKAQGFLLDLGFSSNQLEAQKGFAFITDEPLRMTYSPEAPSVRDILRQTSEQDLADIIYEFGEERYSRRIARAIKETLRREAIDTTGKLAAVVKESLPRSYERGRIHPATRTFQALRIYANDELGNLKKAIANIPLVVRPGGRAAIISFHSLEDRIVKTAFREMAKDGIVSIVTKKPLEASEEEVLQNPRSRSAKLRCVHIL